MEPGDAATRLGRRGIARGASASAGRGFWSFTEGDAVASELAESAELERWRSETLERAVARSPLRSECFETDSGIPIPDLLVGQDTSRLGLPGEYPFTRGTQPSMYRGRLWTMRQFAGFGTPEETNRRFKYLLAQGGTGLSVAFDMPALMGYDCDHPRSRGEVGREGVSVSTLRDFEVLFEGIPLDAVTISMTINATAIVAMAMLVALAERRGLPRAALRGTLQNDVLKEYIAQKEWIVSPRPAVRIVGDMLSYGAKELPHWNMVSVSGYHIREAGADAVQELAFTLADGLCYLEHCQERGESVDAIAQRLSFFWDVQSDFFEEIAKFRAARRLWADLARNRCGARDPKSWMLRAHAQTAGVSLTAQQPHNNLTRVSLQALAAVLGGTQSLHTNSLDETYALPTEEAATLALRTQQIIACETGVAKVVDPLAGSYYVEHLTDQLEQRARALLARIDALGGMVRAIEDGFPQRQIAESAFAFQRQLERGERQVVGVNAYAVEEAQAIPTHTISPTVEARQRERLAAVKRSRDAHAVERALNWVEEAARGTENLMPPVVEAVRAEATLGEVSDRLRKVWGAYREAGGL